MRRAGSRTGRKGRSLRHLAFGHAQCVREARSIRVDAWLPGGLLHALAHGEMRQQQAPKFLLHQLGRLAARFVLVRDIDERILASQPRPNPGLIALASG